MGFVVNIEARMLSSSAMPWSKIRPVEVAPDTVAREDFNNSCKEWTR